MTKIETDVNVGILLNKERNARCCMNVLITGANGFVGSSLVKNFPLSSISSRLENNLLDADALKKLFENQDFDCIYHLAAINSGASFNPSFFEQINVNVIATHNLIEAIEKYSKKKPTIIHLSSIHVYNNLNSGIISESTAIGPKSFYGFTKLAQEEIVLNAAKRGSVKAVIMRCSHIYGPNSRPNYNSYISTLCNDILYDKRIKLTGSGKHLLNLVYIDDVINILTKAHLIACDQPQILNLASDNGVSLIDVIDLLKDISQKKINLEIEDGAHSEYHISNNLLRSLIKINTWTSLRDGLIETYESQNAKK